MSEHAKIIFCLVGTKGELDKPEERYAVYYLDDIPQKIAEKIVELGLNEEYKDYGWSLITAHREMSEDEIKKLLEGEKE